jgi:hypothetical protein
MARDGIELSGSKTLAFEKTTTPQTHYMGNYIRIILNLSYCLQQRLQARSSQV